MSYTILILQVLFKEKFKKYYLCIYLLVSFEEPPEIEHPMIYQPRNSNASTHQTG